MDRQTSPTNDSTPPYPNRSDQSVPEERRRCIRRRSRAGPGTWYVSRTAYGSASTASPPPLVSRAEWAADDDLVTSVVAALEHHRIVPVHRHADLVVARAHVALRDRAVHALPVDQVAFRVLARHQIALRPFTRRELALRIHSARGDLRVGARPPGPEEASVVVAVVVVEATRGCSRGGAGRRGRRGLAEREVTAHLELVSARETAMVVQRQQP